MIPLFLPNDEIRQAIQDFRSDVASHSMIGELPGELRVMAMLSDPYWNMPHFDDPEAAKKRIEVHKDGSIAWVDGEYLWVQSGFLPAKKLRF